MRTGVLAVSAIALLALAAVRAQDEAKSALTAGPAALDRAAVLRDVAIAHVDP